jgi:hypothetical protein
VKSAVTVMRKTHDHREEGRRQVACRGMQEEMIDAEYERDPERML